MTSSVSFRITRTAEDLAQTITALSQRLVKIEQRQEVMELQLRQQLKDVNNVPDEELATLDGIETLLRETRELLESTDLNGCDAISHDQNDEDELPEAA
ncbi:MAG: chemotaxis protein [Parasynechococcus sp.]|jgi:thioesterase domain-containing protein|uniref:chemotaxis protein n=1 Tax=Parasynechococcus sp. TaxID=3101203 RepID=UPI000E184BCE|nr:chemotaxis protein [Synechococcus sp. AH-558-M21]RCL58698.1 MAG: chemotaxis protein [Synechococcus sp. MED-G69]|tara:strand:+ start:1619 stop:1915 length:297 start_codon:yes stop_codon:yes gene_type:complete